MWLRHFSLNTTIQRYVDVKTKVANKSYITLTSNDCLWQCRTHSTIQLFIISSISWGFMYCVFFCLSALRQQMQKICKLTLMQLFFNCVLCLPKIKQIKSNKWKRWSKTMSPWNIFMQSASLFTMKHDLTFTKEREMFLIQDTLLCGEYMLHANLLTKTIRSCFWKAN